MDESETISYFALNFRICSLFCGAHTHITKYNPLIGLFSFLGILVAYFLFDLEFGNNFQIILLSSLMQFLAKMGGHGHGHG